MTERKIDAQIAQETGTAGLENAARRYAAAFLAIAAGEGSQAQLQVARELLAAAARVYVAAHEEPPTEGEEGPS